MSSFTTRVELHREQSGDYRTLHSAMEARGFTRTITDNFGNKYHLPTAEYNFVGDLILNQVLERAKAAAVLTGRDYSVLVTESKGRTWHNLPSA